MPLQPWVGREPVKVEQVVPTQIDSTLNKFQQNVEFEVATWFGPGPNTTWEIESFLMYLACSGVVGSREIYLYFKDRDGDMMRWSVCRSSAVYVNYVIGIPGTPVSPISDTGSARLASIPSPVRRLDYPCQLGMYLTRFDDPGDVASFQMIVRERVQL